MGSCDPLFVGGVKVSRAASMMCLESAMGWGGFLHVAPKALATIEAQPRFF